MKYSKLLSRIGAVMDKLVGMGFERNQVLYQEEGLSYFTFSKYVAEDDTVDVEFNLESDDVRLYSDNGSDMRYFNSCTDNFEQELFDKLKEMGIE